MSSSARNEGTGERPLPTLRPVRQRRRRRWGRWFAIALLLFIAAVVVARYVVLPRVVMSQLRRQVERHLAGDVTVEAIDIDLLAGRLEVIGLEYREPNAETLFSVNSARARFSVHDLWNGDVMPRLLYLEGVDLHLAVDRAGTNVESNLRTPPAGAAPKKLERIPHVVLQNCRINVDAPLAFREKLRLSVNGEVSASAINPLKSQVDMEIAIRYGPEAANKALPPVKLIGAFNAESTAFKLSTDNDGIALDEAFREVLNPTLVAKGWDWVNPVGRVRVDIEGDLHRTDGLPHYRVSLVNAGGLGIRIRDFPYAIGDIQGVTLLEPGSNDRRGRLRLEQLKGAHGPAIAKISGDVFGFLGDPAEPWVHLLLDGRDVPLDDDLKNAIDEVDPEFSRVWDAISPAGSVDFQCLLFKSDQSSRVRAAINAKVKNGNFSYIGFPGLSGDRVGFPYPLTNVQGEFETQLGYSRFEVRGQGAGRSDIHVVGEIRGTENANGHPLIDVRIRGKDVPLDDALRRGMLDLRGEKLWKQIQPAGHADIDVHLEQWNPNEDVRVTVTLDLRGRANFIYDTVPIPLREVTGRVVYRSSEPFPRFEGVSGKLHRGTFLLSGTLGALGNETLSITLLGEVLGRELTRALERSPNPELQSLGKTLSDYQLSGDADASITIRGAGDPRPDVEIRLGGAAANGPALPFSLDALTGKITYDGNFLRLTNVVGWHGAGWIELDGEQRLGGDDAFEYYRVEGQNLEITNVRTTRAGPLKDVGTFLEKVRPRGTLKKVEFEHDTRDPVRFPRFALALGDLTIRPRESWIDRTPLTPDTAPIELGGGTLYYNPKEGIHLRRGSAKIGRTRFERVDANYRPAATPPLMRVRARIEDCAFDSVLADYLGPTVRDALRKIDGRGTFTVDPLDLQVLLPEDGPPNIRLLDDATIRFANAEADAGTRLRGIDGAVVIDRDSYFTSVEDLDLDGRFENLNVRIFRMAVADLTGRFAIEPESLGEETDVFLRLDDLDANLYGGRLGPNCALDLSLRAPHALEGYVRTENVRVDRLLQDLTEKSAPSSVTGLLGGHFRFRADRARIANLIGVGACHVDQGRFGSIPAFVTLFDYFNNHFHRLEATHFEVADRKVHLGSRGHIYADDPIFGYGRPNKPRFTVEGDALTLDGQGAINFGGELEFRFKPSEIWLSTPIPGLRNFLDLLWQQAGTIYVLGTVERIDVQPILFGIGNPRRGEKQPLRIPDRPLWPATRW